MREKLLLAVKNSHEAGICVLPPTGDGSKQPWPDGPHWKKYQTQRPTIEDLRRWYSNRSVTGMAWVCGEISGDLEVIDFDNHETFAIVEESISDANECVKSTFERLKAGYMERTPHGIHLPYRCKKLKTGDPKLARRLIEKVNQDTGEVKIEAETLIEFIGKGRYIIVAPTHGSVNQDGIYTLISGGISTIPTISPDDRDKLHEFLSLFDEMPEKSAPRQKQKTSSSLGDENRPGDIFNREKTWEEILEPHGWTRVRGRGETTDWRRPGKTHGISATTNYKGSDCLYVFSSNTYPLEDGKSYSKFGAWTTLNFNGDYNAATQKLDEEYADRIKDDGVDLSGILNKEKSESSTNRIYKPIDALAAPGMVGELARWILDTSHIKQPLLSLAASLSANAMAMGRKIMGSTGLRTNMYILGIGPAGCGKDRAIEAIRKIYRKIDKYDRVAFDDFASDSALEESIIRMPCMLILWDEIGDMLGVIKKTDNSPHLSGIEGVFKKLTGKSSSVYGLRERAATARAKKEMSAEEAAAATTVNQPCVCLYGLTTKSKLYKGLSSDFVGDGFLSRVLVFETSSEIPHMDYPDVETKNSIPDSIEKYFNAWETYRTKGTGLVNATVHCGILNEIEPEPTLIPCSEEAEKMFREFERATIDRRNTLSKAGDDMSCVLARCGSIARVTGMIFRCSRIVPGDEKIVAEVEASDAAFAINMVGYLVENFYFNLKDLLYDSHQEYSSKLVAKIIREAGNKGIAKSKLTSMVYRKIKRADRDSVIYDLKESGKIKEIEVGTSTKPKRMLLWVCE